MTRIDGNIFERYPKPPMDWSDVAEAVKLIINHKQVIRLHLMFFLFITSSNYSMAQIEIMKNFDVGKYGVGFKHETIKDLSRYEILFGQFNYLFGIPQKKNFKPT